LVVYQRKIFTNVGLGYRLDNHGIVVQFPAGARDFSLLQKIYTNYEVSFPAYKWPVHGTEHSPLCSAEVKNM
jgi:hypothetical protein